MSPGNSPTEASPSAGPEVLVVTGVGGIGRAVAHRSGPGRTVLVGDVNSEALSRVAAELRDVGVRVVADVLDLTSRESIRAFAVRAGELGSVTSLVHTAGVSQSQADRELIVRINLWGTAALFEEFDQILADGSAVVAVASSAAHWAAALDEKTRAALATVSADALVTLPVVADTDRTAAATYSFTKYANQLRVQGRATAWSSKGIRINSLSPGLIATPMSDLERSASGGVLDRIMSDIPAGRLGRPEEIAGAVAFLLGPDASYVQGTDLLVDGGWTGAVDAGALRTPAQIVRRSRRSSRDVWSARVAGPLSVLRSRAVPWVRRVSVPLPRRRRDDGPGG